MLYTDKMDAIAIQTVSRAILFPAQALAGDFNHQIRYVSGVPNEPASKPKDPTVCGVRQIVVDEALWFERLRLYKDSLVVKNGPRDEDEDQEYASATNSFLPGVPEDRRSGRNEIPFILI
jgi:hypothetical protein